MYWKHTIGDHTVEFGCTPFSLGEKRLLDCQYGAQYKKTKADCSTGKRVYLQKTRKKGCPAHIEILEFNLYPEYSVGDLLLQDMLPKQVRRVKEESLKSLRDTLQQNVDVQTTKKYYISLPTQEAHHSCHPTAEIMGFSQRVHPELIIKIHELVHASITDAIQIKCLLKHHVQHYMCPHKLPSINDRAYYPTMDDIRNHINKSKKEMQLSVIDQENVAKLIAQWSKTSSGFHHFRPHKECHNENATESPSQNPCDRKQQSLLWVHQEPWQQQLMLKYGNIISLMDATYKTTRYDLPLFFISVRTNTGYCIVAEFIVQSESAESIKEAIAVLKEWNPEWCPNYFMTDFSEAEIQALESSFPSSTIYLCDFHREQAWERWARDKSHGLSSTESELLLDHLRACAWASSVDDDPTLPHDYHYQQALKVLKETNIWKKNEHVREWLNGTWLDSCKVSCKTYNIHRDSYM